MCHDASETCYSNLYIVEKPRRRSKWKKRKAIYYILGRKEQRQEKLNMTYRCLGFIGTSIHREKKKRERELFKGAGDNAHVTIDLRYP